MKVELALDPSQMVSLASRVAPAPTARAVVAPRRGRPAGRGRNPRPAKKSAEELDAEMTVSNPATTQNARLRPIIGLQGYDCFGVIIANCMRDSHMDCKVIVHEIFETV